MHLQVLRTFFYHRRSLVPWLVLVGGVTVLYSLFVLAVRPTYTASTTVTMLPSSFEIGFTSGRGDFSGVNPAMVLTQTHAEFLLSKRIAGKVVDSLAGHGITASRRSGLGTVMDRTIGRLLSLVSKTVRILNSGRHVSLPEREAYIARLRRNTRVDNVPGSYILSISVSWTSPEIATRAANLLAHFYMHYARAQNQAAITQTAGYIEEQLREMERRRGEIENNMRRFKEDERLYALAREIDLKTNEMYRYREEMNSTMARIEGLSARIDHVGESVAKLQAQSQKSDLESLWKAYEFWQERYNSIRGELSRLPEQEARYYDFVKELDKVEETIGTLQKNLVQTRISEAAVLSAIRVIDPAEKPAYPRSPRVLFSVLASLVAAFFLWCTWVLGKEYFRGSIHHPGNPAITDLACAGLLPASSPGKGAVSSTASPNGGSRRRRLYEKHREHCAIAIPRNVSGSTLCLLAPSRKDLLDFPLVPIAARMPGRVALLDCMGMSYGNRKGYSVDGTEGYSVDYRTVRPPLPGGSADGFRAAVSDAQRDLRQSHDLVVTVIEPLDGNPYAVALAELNESLMLLVDASTTTSRAVQEARNLAREVRRPLFYVMTNVRYPPDRLFTA